MSTIICQVQETIGTVTYLRPPYPIAGTSALASFVDDSGGTSGAYTKTFCYSLDGVQYSDWMPFTNPNLAAISFTQWDIFVIELAYDSSTGTGLHVTEATITGTITEPDNGPIFAKSIFARLLDEYDPEVIGWYVSVVNKLYGRGLLAKYIQKVNVNGTATDFIAYWSAIAKFFAYFVVYARRYQDMYNNSDLLGEFLIERGLTVSINDTLVQRQFLACNFYAEIMKRGTIRIIDDENSGSEVFGELLRLIYYVSTDEFMFNLYRSKNFGWNLTNSSPLYRGLSWVNENLNKYKAYNVGSAGPAPWVKISPTIPYEVTFFFTAPATSSIIVSINAVDVDDNPVTLQSAYDGSSTNTFLADFYPERYDVGIFYRLIIYPEGTTPTTLDITNVNNGNNLIFVGTEKKIQVVLSTKISSVITPVTDLRFVKIFPLVTDYSRGFIQVKNFISCWLLNNNKNYTLQGLEQFIRRYLIPYDSYIKITEVDDSDSGSGPSPIVVMPTINKTVTPGPYHLGDTITYTITVDNTASVTDFFGCTIQDIMPVGADYTLFTPAVVSYDTGTRTATWVLDVLAGSTVTITIVAILHASGTITNADYTVTPPGYAVIHGTPLPITVTVPITISKTVVNLAEDHVAYIVGDNIMYTIQVTNSSGTTFTGVTVTDHVDLTKLLFVSASPIVPITIGGDVIWTGVTLPPLSITLFTVTCKIIAAGAITNTYSALLPPATEVDGTPVTITAILPAGLTLTEILKPSMKAAATLPGVDPTVTPFMYDITISPDTDFVNFYPLVFAPVHSYYRLRKDQYMAYLAPAIEFPQPPYAGNSWRYKPHWTSPSTFGTMIYIIPGVGFPTSGGPLGQYFQDSMGNLAIICPFIVLDPATNSVLDYLCTKIDVTLVSSTLTTATLRLHATENTPSDPDYLPAATPLWFYDAAGGIADPLHPGDPNWKLVTLSAGDHYLGVARWFETNPGLKNFPQTQFSMLIRLS